MKEWSQYTCESAEYWLLNAMRRSSLYSHVGQQVPKVRINSLKNGAPGISVPVRTLGNHGNPGVSLAHHMLQQIVFTTVNWLVEVMVQLLCLWTIHLGWKKYGCVKIFKHCKVNVMLKVYLSSTMSVQTLKRTCNIPFLFYPASCAWQVCE